MTATPDHATDRAYAQGARHARRGDAPHPSPKWGSEQREAYLQGYADEPSPAQRRRPPTATERAALAQRFTLHRVGIGAGGRD